MTKLAPAPDDQAAHVRGWQNVARMIRQHLRAYSPRPNEPPLTAVELAEHEAWQAAERVVVEGIDGDASPDQPTRAD